MLFLLFLAIYFGASPATNPDAHLVAYYNFDNCDARSALHPDADARVYGETGCECGVAGQALAFDGRSSSLEFPGRINNYFTTSDFTLSFYLHPEGHQALPQALFTKDATCTDDHMLALTYTSGTRELDAQLHETPHKSYQRLEYTLLENGWLHYTLVREGPEARTYLNGELQRQTRRCSGIDLSNTALLTFARPRCRTAPYRGLLDELRLYDRALTDAEVRALYRQHPVENAGADCLTSVPEGVEEVVRTGR